MTNERKKNLVLHLHFCYALLLLTGYTPCYMIIVDHFPYVCCGKRNENKFRFRMYEVKNKIDKKTNSLAYDPTTQQRG